MKIKSLHIDMRKWKVAIELAAIAINIMARQIQVSINSFKEMNKNLNLLDEWAKESKKNVTDE